MEDVNQGLSEIQRLTQLKEGAEPAQVAPGSMHALSHRHVNGSYIKADDCPLLSKAVLGGGMPRLGNPLSRRSLPNNGGETVAIVDFQAAESRYPR